MVDYYTLCFHEKIIWDLTMMKAGAAGMKTEKFEKQHSQ